MADKKRKKALISSPASPTNPAIMESALNTIMTKLDAMSAQLAAQLSKSEQLETAVVGLTAKLAEAVSGNKEKDIIIARHSDQINNCEQALRSTSIRILGLPVKKDDSTVTIIDAVYENILRPVLEAAKVKGELTEHPSRRFMIDFAIPSKNPSSCPVIVKFSSSFIRNLVFSYKNDVLPKTPDPNSSRIRHKFAIFEDLTPANFAHLRTLTEDPRTTSIWTYNGMVKFRVKDSETIYRSRSITDTVDSILKPKQNPLP